VKVVMTQAVCAYDGQREHFLAPVLPYPRRSCPITRRGHAPSVASAPGIAWKQTLRPDVLAFTCLPRPRTGLDYGVRGPAYVHREPLVSCEKDRAHPALIGRARALERGADADLDHRRLMVAGTDADVAHFLRDSGNTTSIGRPLTGSIDSSIAMVLAHGPRGPLRDRPKERPHRLERSAASIRGACSIPPPLLFQFHLAVERTRSLSPGLERDRGVGEGEKEGIALGPYRAARRAPWPPACSISLLDLTTIFRFPRC